MKKLILAIAIFLGASPLWAELMTYQGRLKESNIPVTGNRLFTFEFCDAEDGSGVCLVAPGTPAPFAVANGLFKSTITIHPSVDLAAGAWYLRVTVGSSVLAPLERLTAVPYSVFASSAGYSSYAAGALLKAGDTMTGQLTLDGSTLTVTGNEFSVGGSTFVVKNGYVGIGTSSPNNPLQVHTNGLYVFTGVATGASAVLNVVPQAGGTVMLNNNAGGSVALTVGHTKHLLVDNSGNVGISSVTPSYRLVVSSGAGETGTIMAVSTGTSNLFWVAGDGAHATKFYGDGSGLSGVTGATDNTKVLRAGDTMTGPLHILSDDLANDTSDFITTGLVISTGGALQTTGAGHGTGVGSARGTGAVDLQTSRTNSNEVASGYYSVLAGGRSNKSSGFFTVVGGGQGNSATGDRAAVLGGDGNAATAYTSMVGGGTANKASGYSSVVTGGMANTASNYYTSVGGGNFNVVSGSNSAAGGGVYNTVIGTSAVIAGGENNAASGMFSSVLGGKTNAAAGNFASVGGGYNNTAAFDGAVVAGGTGNDATGTAASITGGANNLASASWAAVGGGNDNRATGMYSTVPGGYNNTAEGNYSFAAGGRSSSTAQGAFTWQDSGGAAINLINNVTDRTVFKSRGGFLVTGSTNTSMTGTLDRGVIVTGNGLLGVAIGAPQAALDVVSTGITANDYAQIWRDSDGVSRASVTATGVFYGDGSGLTGVTAAGAVQKAGDTMNGTLDMGGNFLAGVSTITMYSGSIAIVPPGTGGTSVGYGISIGSNSYSNSDSGIGIGYGAYLNSYFSVGLGAFASENGSYGVGLGAFASRNYNSGVGVGAEATENFQNGTGIGHSAKNNDNYGVGVGAYAQNNDNYAVGVGAYSQYNAGYGAALGAYSYASSSATALGAQAKANAELSLALGYGTVNDSTGTASFGNYAINAPSYWINGSTVIRQGPGIATLAIGSVAGMADAGAYNLFVGSAAGHDHTSGANNVMLGYGAGYQNTNGAGNTFIGAAAANTNSAGDQNIIIGYNQQTSAPGASSELNIGGLIFGQIGAKTVGISTRAPQAALDVVSTGTGAGFYAQIWRDATGLVVSSVSSQGIFYGNGSGLTGVTAAGAVQKTGDTMQGALDMGGNFLAGVSTITMYGGSIAIVPPGTAGSNNNYGVSIGSNSYNNSDFGVGVGGNSYGNSSYGVGVGHGAYGNSNYSVGVGKSAFNNYSYGVGVGYGASGNYNNGVGVGNAASVNSVYGVGVGAHASNNDNYAVGIGAYSQNNQPYGAALGAYSYAASSSVALGYMASANAWNSVAIGSGTVNNSTGTASFGILAVHTSSAVNAGYYQINGSTAIAVLPGVASLGVGIGAGGGNTGNFNTFVGHSAANFNTSGANNVFVGHSAGYANNTGSDNTFIGQQSGAGNNSGLRNAFVGVGSGYRTRTGAANSILGYRAGYGVGTNSFSSSTILGYQAGFGLETGSDNVLVGFQAGYGITTGTGNIVIGYNKDTSAPAANNELNVGGVLFGDLSARTIGISTRVPAAALDIVSTGTAANVYAQIWRASDGVVKASVTATGVFYGDGSGLSGITASDNTKLPLSGGTLTGNFGVSAATMTLNASGNSANLITAGLTSGATMIMYADLSSLGLFTQNPAHRVGIGAGMTEALTVTQNRAGVNNTSPYYTLDVNGPGRFADQVIAGGSVTVAGSAFSVGSSTFVVNAGRVGINSPTPEAALQVSGGAKFLSGDGTSYILTAGSAARPDMFFVSSGGIVGVGDFSSYPVSTDTLVNIAPVLKAGDNIALGLQIFARSDTATAVTVSGEQTGVLAANFEAEAGGDDSMEHLVGLRAQVRREGAGSGTVQRAAGVWIDRMYSGGGGLTVNTYGIHISTLSVPGQSNAPYAIYSEEANARTYFAGNVGISSATPAYALAVSSGTGDLLWVSSYAVHAMKFVGDGSGLTGLSGVQKTGDTMTGQLTISGSSLTIRPAVSDAYSLYVSSADGLVPALTVRPGGELYTAGRVGIGSPAPAEALDISGRVLISTRAGGNEVTDGLISNGTGGMEYYSGGNRYMKVANGGGYIGVGPSANVYSNTLSPRLQVRGSMSVGSGYNSFQPPAESLVVQGRLGVGTPAPDAALSVVQSDVGVSSYTVHIGTSASAYHLVVTTAGWVGLNTQRPQAPLHLTAATKDEGIVVEHNSDTAEGSYLALLKARGTANSQTLVAEGDNLGVLAFGGYNNTAGDPFPMAAAIVGRVDGTPTVSAPDMPGRLEFMTAADNTNVTVTRMVIRNDGGVGIATGTPQAMLDILSTSTVAQIWRDAAGVARATMTADGTLYAMVGSAVQKSGDSMTGALSITPDPAVYIYDLMTNGIQISTAGSIVTVGIGNGVVGAGQRGMGAVDLQTARATISQVALGDFSTLSGGAYNTALGSGTVMAGGLYNIAAGSLAVISGGQNNYADARFSAVGGGKGNTASADYAAVFSGSGNLVAGAGGFIGGGQGNTVEFNYGVIVGGMNNLVDAAADYGFVGGGYGNSLNGTHAAIAGGWDNTANGMEAFVGAGYKNVANGEKSVVGGGTFNTTDARYGVIAGGYENKMQSGADAAFIGGGRINTVTATGLYAAVVGGSSNTVEGEGSFIGGGGPDTPGNPGNKVYSSFSSIVGGSANIIDAAAHWGFIGGGSNNQVSTEHGLVSGGSGNRASGLYSTVVGGYTNKAAGDTSAVGGGASNMASGDYAAVPGGYQNTAKGNYSFAAGHKSSSTLAGTFTWADSQGVEVLNAVQDQVRFKARGGFLVSGSTNTADPGFFVSGDGSVTMGNGLFISRRGAVQTTGLGTNNVSPNTRDVTAVDLQNHREDPTQIASAYLSVISGGGSNRAGDRATVGGGQYNAASGQGSAVAGGYNNTASGAYSAVPGGAYNNASSDYSFAAGRRSQSGALGAFTWADSRDVPLFNNVQDRVWFKASGGFLVSGSTSTADPGLFVSGDGRVSVGATSIPANPAKLQVNGDLGLGDGTQAGNAPVVIWLTASTLFNDGDVVVASGNYQFGTTTTGSLASVIGVAMGSGAASSTGKIAVAGVVTANCLNGTAGQHAVTSATAGQVQGIGSPSSGTSVGLFLTNCGNPVVNKAILLLK